MNKKQVIARALEIGRKLSVMKRELHEFELELDEFAHSMPVTERSEVREMQMSIGTPITYIDAAIRNLENDIRNINEDHSDLPM